MTMLPSPTPAATRFTEPARTSPVANTPSELDTIVEFVTNSPHQVLLIHGPGGVEKSRLAFEAALRLIQDGGAVNTVYCGTAT